MRGNHLLEVLRPVLLSMVLTAACPSMAETCAESVVARPSIEHLSFQALNPTKTPKDVIRFWSNVYAKAFRGRLQWNDFAIHDYVKPLVQIRDQFTSSDTTALFNVLDELALLEYGDWESVVRPLRILFHPETAESFFFFEKDISEYAEGIAKGTYPKDFSFATVTALANLPAAQSKLMKDFFYRKIAKLRENPPLNKFVRRNAEIVYRALFENDFQSFIRGLAQTIGSSRSIDGAVASLKINSYWERLKFGQNYSFEHVLAVAKVIQQSQILNDYPNEGLYLLGSFANGVAEFPRSDIDLHPTPGLEKVYEETFGYFGSHLKPEDKKDGPAARAMQKLFLDLEKSIGKVVGLRSHSLFRKGFKPGELMAISAGQAMFAPDDWFSPKYMQQQSPIMLKIYRNKIILQVYDAYHSRHLLEAEITGI